MGGGTGKTLSAIDLYVKKVALGDAIKLAKKSKAKVLETLSFRSLQRIVPLDESDPACSVFDTLTEMRALYCQLAPVKSKEGIRSSNFEKLLQKSPILKDSGLT